jgi:hypothetical protein
MVISQGSHMSFKKCTMKTNVSTLALSIHKSKIGFVPKSFCSNFLEFKHIVAFCYESQHSLTLQGHVPSPQVWAIAQTIANILGPMVQQCVLNQS